MKTWYGIDFFKIISAVLIVYMHTYCGDWGYAGSWIKEVLSTACVPFFFIASGFFLRKGIDSHETKGGPSVEKSWFRHYIIRLVKMYIAWSVITFPISVMIVKRAHPDNGLAMKILYEIRLFFLAGSIGVYWYLLALILGAIIIRWGYKRGVLVPLMVASSVLFLYGCLYNSPINRGQSVFEVLHIVFGSERNVFNVGLFFILIGFLCLSGSITTKELSSKWVASTFLVVAILIRTLEWALLKTNFTHALVAITAFMTAISSSYKGFSSVSFAMRRMSIGLYLLHFPFILLFDFYLKKCTLIDFPITLVFSIIVYYLAGQIAPKVTGVLFGYQRPAASHAPAQ